MNVSSISWYAVEMGAYIPPGWPAGVHPPGSEDFESMADGWLLEGVRGGCAAGIPHGQDRARGRAAAARDRHGAGRVPQGKRPPGRQRRGRQPGRARAARRGIHAEDEPAVGGARTAEPGTGGGGAGEDGTGEDGTGEDGTGGSGAGVGQSEGGTEDSRAGGRQREEGGDGGAEGWRG